MPISSPSFSWVYPACSRAALIFFRSIVSSSMAWILSDGRDPENGALLDRVSFSFASVVEYASTAIDKGTGMDDHLKKAIELCGGPVKLSLSLGLHKTAVYKWGDQCPPERVLGVSELTGWAVTPHQLRPDLYPNRLDGLPLVAA
jgi:DNA-binding transcriptional regulator YdaS (Cro superfamily)